MMLQSSENGSVHSKEYARCPKCGAVFRILVSERKDPDFVAGFSVRCPVNSCRQHFEFGLYSPPMIPR